MSNLEKLYETLTVDSILVKAHDLGVLISHSDAREILRSCPQMVSKPDWNEVEKLIKKSDRKPKAV